MRLEIEVFLGPSMVGQKFVVSDGSSIGRTKGTFNVSDSKISGLHARVTANPEGGLFLVDQDSSNGIKVDGNRVDRISLEPGARFQLGRTTFIVVRRLEEDDLAAEVDQPPIGGQTSPAEPKPDGWRSYLNFTLPTLSTKDLVNESGATAFVPPLKLVVTSGIQTDCEFILGFGPRKVGANGLDIELKEDGCPDIAFEISPSINGPKFSTNHPELVFLNDSSTSGELLSEGDTIRFGKSVIQIHFILGETY